MATTLADVLPAIKALLGSEFADDVFWDMDTQCWFPEKLKRLDKDTQRSMELLFFACEYTRAAAVVTEVL